MAEQKPKLYTPPKPAVPGSQPAPQPVDPNDPRYNPNVLTGQIDPRTNQPRPTDKNQDTTELQRLQSHLTDHTMRMTPEQRRDAEARVGVLKQKIAAVYK
jgi:hypothetical protein